MDSPPSSSPLSAASAAAENVTVRSGVAAKAEASWRRSLRIGLISVAAGLIGIVGLNAWVLGTSKDRIFDAGGTVPPQTVALVLGTSAKGAGGGPNRFFEARMDAAALLVERGLVKTLLVSGDNRSASYNEPRDMRDALMRRGVPASAIVCDYAGLRTLDSVVRAHRVFGVNRCLIVSDRWHLPRAIFIAQEAGMDAAGVAGRDVEWRSSVKSRGREWLARVLVVFDLFVTRTQPQHGADGSEPQLSEEWPGRR